MISLTTTGDGVVIEVCGQPGARRKHIEERVRVGDAYPETIRRGVSPGSRPTRPQSLPRT